MSLEFEPHQENAHKEGEKDSYTLERLPIMEHALLGLSFGALALGIERRFPSSAQGNLKEGYEKNKWLLKYFAERSLKGFNFTEKIFEAIDENKFETLKLEYERRIREVQGENERHQLEEEWEKILKLREQALKEEKIKNQTRNSILDEMRELFN